MDNCWPGLWADRLAADDGFQRAAEPSGWSYRGSTNTFLMARD